MYLKWKHYLRTVSVAGINPVKHHQWLVAANAEDCAQQAADFLARSISQTLQQKSQCLIALPGGRTPVLCLQLLASISLPWDRCHWFLGDERCYPQNHPERNDSMIQDSFLSLIDVPEHHFHPIASELGAEKAAAEYSKILAAYGNLDIVFLGMGEDGHTASLFPNNPGLNEKSPAIAVHDSPKPPPDRVSLSCNTLRAAEIRLVLVTGESKQSVIRQIREGAELPINMIGPVHWFIDQPANGN